MASSARVENISFGEFEAKLGSRELCRKGVRVRLPDQSFQILAMLLEHRGELVTREQIRLRLWPGDTFVDFDHGLNNAVNRLREALGDSADSPHFIETLPRRGYRFIAPAQVGSTDASSAQLSSPPPTEISTPLIPTPIVQTGSDSTVHITRTRGSISGRRFLAAIVVVLLILAFAAAMYWVQHRAVAPPQIQSLVVLPLENVSGNASQEYFADGMTDSLITKLAGLRSVRVISRTSAMHYKASGKTLPDIAHELSVDAVVEGTVMRVGDHVRINAQLIDARTDRHLWASTYDRNLRDVLALQSDLASAIANQVASRVDERSKPNVARSLNPEAYDAYLRGRQEWVHGAFTEQGYEKSREYFNRALQLDPEYGDAIVGLAEIYIPQDPAAARALALRALELNGDVGAAHTILGLAKVSDWEFTSAESEFKRAIDLEPNSVKAHSWYGVFLAQIGRSDDGIRELKIAESLDPLALDVQADTGLALYLARRYDEAEQVLQRILRQDANMVIAHRHLVRIYAARDQIPEYISELVKANAWYERTPEQINALTRLSSVYASGGAQAFWQAYLQRELRTPTVDALGLARIYAHLGDRDRCIEILEKEYRQKELMLVVWVKSDPEFDSVRPDPRFQALLTKIGYPQ